jgi:hypothetical protein
VFRSRLPPLNAIKAFEAASRLGSFTRAAEELNVTHGAVSPSQTLNCICWGRISGAPNNSRRDSMAS